MSPISRPAGFPPNASASCGCFSRKQYLSLDYSRQDLVVFSVGENRQIGFEQAPVAKAEPLKLQFDAFLDAVEIAKRAEMFRLRRTSNSGDSLVDS